VRSGGYWGWDGVDGLGGTIGLFGGTAVLSSERRAGRDGCDWIASWDSKEGLTVIDTGLLLDDEDVEYERVAAIGASFGLVSP